MVEQDHLYDVRSVATTGAAQKIARGHVLDTGSGRSGVHPPILFTFTDLRVRVSDGGAISVTRLPTSLILLLVSVAATGPEGSQEMRLQRALSLLSAKLDHDSRPQLVQNMHAYHPDLPRLFGAAAAAPKREKRVVLTEKIRAGMPGYARLQTFPEAEAEFVFVRDGDDLHLIRITIRNACIAVSVEDMDYHVDGAHLSPNQLSPLLLNEAEFVEQIEPFSFDDERKEKEDKEEVEEEPLAPPPLSMSPARPVPVLTHIEQGTVWPGDTSEFRRTRMFTTTTLQFLIARLFSGHLTPFFERNREVFVCSSDIVQVLTEAENLRPGVPPDEIVRSAFDKNGPHQYIGNYNTEPCECPPRSGGHLVDGRRSLLVDRDFLFFPVNHHNTHWVLYLFWRPFRARTRDETDAALIFLFDSLPGAVSLADHQHAIRFIKLFLMHVERLYLGNEMSHSYHCSVVQPVSCGVQPPRSNACGFYVVETIRLFLTSPAQRQTAIDALCRRENPFGARLTFTSADWAARSTALLALLKEHEYTSDK